MITSLSVFLLYFPPALGPSYPACQWAKICTAQEPVDPILQGLLTSLPAPVTAQTDKNRLSKREQKYLKLREIFQNASAVEDRKYTDAQLIQTINESLPLEYLIGPGDLVEVQVWDQPELSGRHTVGPSGKLSLPLIGEMKVQGLTRTEAANLVKSRLETYYRDLFVNFQIIEYNNNRVFVLGRVANPGIVRFSWRGNLLEALSLAGSIPVLDRSTQLTKCAVIRGKNEIIWIDLKALLVDGNLNLNLHLANNDIIFIPDGHDALVYVMGEVVNPGAYRITTEMSFLDALMLAGGITLDGKKTNVRLIRNKDGEPFVLKIDMARFRKGDYQHDVTLRENDIIYVSRKGLAKFEYVLNKFSPLTQIFLIREAISND